MQSQPDYANIRNISAPLTPITLTLAATIYTIWIRTANNTPVIRKLHWYLPAGANGRLQIGTGTGGAWVQRMPDITVLNGLSDVMTEEQIVRILFEGNITAQCTVAGLVLSLEVEEIDF